MKNKEAIDNVWNSLIEVEDYFKIGIQRQLQAATSFSGDEAIPLHKARSTYYKMEPFLPEKMRDVAIDTVKFSYDLFNQYLNSLREVVASEDNEKRKTATEASNDMLNSCLRAYREKLNEFKSIIPEDSDNSTIPSINISGNVSGMLNIAGGSVNSANMNITLNELIKRVEESNDLEKEDVKSQLSKILKHPLVVKLISGAAGSVIG